MDVQVFGYIDSAWGEMPDWRTFLLSCCISSLLVAVITPGLTAGPAEATKKPLQKSSLWESSEMKVDLGSKQIVPLQILFLARTHFFEQ